MPRALPPSTAAAAAAAAGGSRHGGGPVGDQARVRRAGFDDGRVMAMAVAGSIAVRLCFSEMCEGEGEGDVRCGRGRGP
jgi:hypothetical protein